MHCLKDVLKPLFEEPSEYSIEDQDLSEDSNESSDSDPDDIPPMQPSSYVVRENCFINLYCKTVSTAQGNPCSRCKSYLISLYIYITFCMHVMQAYNAVHHLRSPHLIINKL